MNTAAFDSRVKKRGNKLLDMVSNYRTNRSKYLLVFKAPYNIASVGVSISLMMFVSLHVHQLHGMIEAHFGYFIFIAALFSYLNWRP